MPDLFSFKDWLEGLSKLSDDQKQELLKRLQSDMETESDRKSKEQETSKILSCPHCGCVDNIVKHGTKDGKQRFRCKDCGKTFSLTTETFFYRSRIEEWQWKKIIRGMIQNLSISKIADSVGLGTTAVWKAKNKIMELISEHTEEQDKLFGVVECDETFIRMSFKGKRDPKFFVYQLGRLPRHHRSRVEKTLYLKEAGLYEELQQDPERLETLLRASKVSETALPGTNGDLVCILTAADGSNDIFIKPVCLGSIDQVNVEESFDERIKPNSILVSDGTSVYTWFAEERNIPRESILASQHRNGAFNLALVNSLHSQYKMFYSKDRRNIPAIKYLDIGTQFFWFIEKNKKESIQAIIDKIYKLIQENKVLLSYEEYRHRELKLDTKGLIPKKV